MRAMGTLWALALLGPFAGAAAAEPPAAFKFAKGQVLQYKVKQTTRAVDVIGDEKTEVSSITELTKRWEVKDVDAQGGATLELSFTRLALTQKRPDGTAAAYDSAEPDKAGTDEGLKKALSPMVGKVMVVLRVGPAGNVVEVKESKQGPASRYQSELPFAITLPAEALARDRTWKRSYQIVLDPPLGAGEKYDAEQTYTVKGIEADRAHVAFSTALKQPPEKPEERVPLLQFQPRGAAYFDLRRGVLLSAAVVSSGTVAGHQGEGSRYEFHHEYTEQLLAD